MVTSSANQLITKKIRHSLITLDEIITSGRRLEATHYSNEGRDARNLISRYKGDKITIKEILEKSLVPPPTQRNFIDNSDIGTPYLTPSDLLFNKI